MTKKVRGIDNGLYGFCYKGYASPEYPTVRFPALKMASIVWTMLPDLTPDIYFNFLLSLRKYYAMTVSDLKLRLFRQIDTLDKSKLEEIYGVLINFINGQKDISEWEKLSGNQKKGILDAIEELEVGKGNPNKVVLDKFRKKYSHV